MSIIRLDRSWLTTTDSFILIHMSNMEAIWAKIQNLKNFFFGVGGIMSNMEKNRIRTFWIKIPKYEVFFYFFGYIKSRVPGHQNVSKCRYHHSGDIYIHTGKQLKTSCSYMGQNVKKFIFLAIWGALGGLQWSDWAYLALQVYSHQYLCTCEIRKKSDKNFLSSNPKYENKNNFFIFEGPSCSYMGPNVIFF